MLAAIVILPSAAQNNPYKIDDELYSVYMRCNKMIKDKKVIAMADSLFRQARQKRDTKAQCLAWHVKCDHYYYIQDIPSLQETIKNARKFIERTPHKQYIFSTWIRLISYYEMQRYYGKALAELQLFREKAIQMNNTYGITLSYKHFANIYTQQKNHTKSLELYKKALEYSVSQNEMKELYGLYLAMGAIYNRLSFPDSAYVCYQRALNRVQNEPGKMVVYIQMTDAALRIEHIDTAYHYIQKVEELRRKTPLYGANADIHFTNVADYYRAIKEYGKAIVYSDSIQRKTTRFREKELICKDMGDFKQAYIWFKKFIVLRDSTQTEETNHLLADLTSRFDNERLNAEKDRLELRASNLELEREKDRRQLLEMEKERNQFQLKNQELSLQQQRAELESSHRETYYQKERAEMLEARSQQNLITSVVLGILLLTVFTLALIYTLFRRRSFKRLE